MSWIIVLIALGFGIVDDRGTWRTPLAIGLGLAVPYALWSVWAISAWRAEAGLAVPEWWFYPANAAGALAVTLAAYGFGRLLSRLRRRPSAPPG